MTITFLGTGTSQGVPVIGCSCEVCKSVDFRDKRLRCSIHIQTDNDASFVIDTGPDFRQQMLRERINRLDAVIYTHEHKDHTAGMDDVRAYNFKQRKDMPIYAQQKVIDQLKKEFSYVFSSYKYPGVPQIDVNEINSDPFVINDTEIIPIEVMHYKLPVLGFRIKDFTYITDANHIDDNEKDKIRGSQVLVMNALQKEPHISHFTLSEAIELVNELEVPQAYFIHMSHKLGLHSKINDELPSHIRLAYDGMRISV